MDPKIVLGVIVAIVVIDALMYASYQPDYSKMDQLKSEISQEKLTLASLKGIVDSAEIEIAQNKTQLDDMKLQLDTLKTQMDKMNPSEYNQNVDQYNSLVNKYNTLRETINALVYWNNENLKKYNLKTDITNRKVNSLNELAGKSRWYLIPIPIPHFRL